MTKKWMKMTGKTAIIILAVLYCMAPLFYVVLPTVFNIPAISIDGVEVFREAFQSLGFLFLWFDMFFFTPIIVGWYIYTN